jgi:hypothetical protein
MANAARRSKTTSRRTGATSKPRQMTVDRFRRETREAAIRYGATPSQADAAAERAVEVFRD